MGMEPPSNRSLTMDRDHEAQKRRMIMDFSNSPLLSGIAARLDFLAARTGVIAQNIANADTPDYAAKDVKAPDFRALTERAADMRVSDPRHVRSAGPAHGFKEIAAPDPDASLTGNRVSIETQAMKLSETRAEYALATTVYRRAVAMIRLAARGQ